MGFYKNGRRRKNRTKESEGELSIEGITSKSAHPVQITGEVMVWFASSCFLRIEGYQSLRARMMGGWSLLLLKLAPRILKKIGCLSAVT